MKYKALKDYIDENGQMTRVGDTWDSSCKTKFEEALLENGFIEKITDGGFEDGDKYYYVDDYGDVTYSYFYENPFDTFRQSQGNAFRTKEEAEEYLEYLKAKAVLRADATPWGKLAGKKWFVYRGDIKNKLSITWYANLFFTSQFCFSTPVEAEASIKNHEKEWHIVFDYEREHGA